VVHHQVVSNGSHKSRIGTSKGGTTGSVNQSALPAGAVAYQRLLAFLATVLATILPVPVFVRHAKARGSADARLVTAQARELAGSTPRFMIEGESHGTKASFVCTSNVIRAVQLA
jgi:hypothetical protein